MRNLKEILTITLFTLPLLMVTNGLVAQINVEALKQKEKPFNHSLHFDLSSLSGNTELLHYRTGFQSRYKEGPFELFLTGTFQQTYSEDNRILNKGFYHLRGYKHLNEKHALEAFIQREYDDFILLKNRQLAGASYRLAFPKLHMYVASGAFLEFERYTNGAQTTLLRSSSYFSIQKWMTQQLSLTTTTYFMPAFDDFSDYRVLSETQFKYFITKQFFYRTGVRYRFDSQPEGDVKKYDLELTQGLTFQFN